MAVQIEPEDVLGGVDFGGVEQGEPVVRLG
jgi:hypothetical protein